MSTSLMHGLDDKNNQHASLQMQFFWKYISRLKALGRLSFGSSGDADINPNENSEIHPSAAKSDSGLGGDISRVDFSQTMTFFNALTELEEVLRDLVFDFISKQRMQKREHIDFSNIAKHLGQAVYLDNDVIMFERMPANQMLVLAGEHDIVGMAAFVLRAIYTELLFWEDNDTNWKLPNDAVPLIEAFEDKFHIPFDAKLFADWGWEQSGQRHNAVLESVRLRDHLKGVLTDIDEQTPFKTPDYEAYYDALHDVLFDGDCSIKSLMPAYHQAWEELCVFHLVQNQTAKPAVAWCDYGNLSFYINVDLSIRFATSDFKDFRENWLDCNKKGREEEGREDIYKRPDDGSGDIYKRPDLILKTEDRYIVYDFKHYSTQDQGKIIEFDGHFSNKAQELEKQAQELEKQVQELEKEAQKLKKLDCDIKSLNFYALCVARKNNPYGNITILSPKKRLCFPTEEDAKEDGSTDYFDFQYINTKTVIENYLKYDF